MRARLVAILAVGVLVGACAAWTTDPQYGSHSCSDAPDPAQCVHASRERAERADDREARRQLEHRTKRQDRILHEHDAPDDGPPMH
ncbi:MAG TPA: hypothetical protein VG943_03935 [Caulobacterales bacterium]|nr:hypothetical protein [Caulobacterales bacterium]